VFLINSRHPQFCVINKIRKEYFIIIGKPQSYFTNTRYPEVTESFCRVP